MESKEEEEGVNMMGVIVTETEAKTAEELISEQRIRYDLLWVPPYDGLKLWTRIWRHGLTQWLSLRRYEQSPALRLFAKKFSKEIELLRHNAVLMSGTAEQKIVEIVRELPEWQMWAKHVPGVAELSLGKLLGYIGNPAARELFSSLARHCGVAVVNGRIEKAQKGQKRPYNPLAKSQLWLIVNNVVRTYPKSPNLYGEIYYLSKEKFRRKHPDWTQMHVHLAAILRTARLFLSHLWEVCRETQELPRRNPYPIEYFGHTVAIPYTMALHPVKKRDEVVAAIEAVSHMLEKEPDIEVAMETKELLTRLEQHIAQMKRPKA